MDFLGKLPVLDIKATYYVLYGYYAPISVRARGKVHAGWLVGWWLFFLENNMDGTTANLNGLNVSSIHDELLQES